jgi:hypothetical protein
LSNAGLPVQGTPITSFSDSLGFHVFLYELSNPLTTHVYQLYYQASTGKWQNQDITATANGVPPSGSLTSFADSLGEHVFYEGTDQHIHQLYGHNTWTDQDLTVISRASVDPAAGTSLTSFVDSLGEHFFYIATDSHIHQLYGHNTWSDQDLTAAATGVSPSSGTVLTGFNDAQGEHVYFIGADNRVHQLWGHNSWSDQDLTSMTGNLLFPPVASSLASFANTYGEHVYYLSNATPSKDDIMELCGCSGRWLLNDTTEHTSGQPGTVLGSPLSGYSSGTGTSTIGQVPYLGSSAAGSGFADVKTEYCNLACNNISGGANWQSSDVTSLTGAPPARDPSFWGPQGLSSFQQ